MRATFLRLFALGLLVLAGCGGQVAPKKSVLPLHSLRIYETGVGYFERGGTIPRAEEAGLPVPGGHLDDALKTLVILSGSARAEVDGVEFGSRLSHGMARALAGLSLEDDAPITYGAILKSFEGTRVEVVTTKGPMIGRLVHVDRDAQAGTSSNAKGDDESEPPAGSSRKGSDDDTASGGTTRGSKTREPLTVTVLGERGVVRLKIDDVQSIRPTDPAQAARLDSAIESLLAHGAAQHHDLRLRGREGASVTIGYVAETPVWRTSYRIVMGKKADHATLQAWALLHNDTDEDWHGVHVELVNGRPDSFLFPLAAPRYARRALLTPENELATVPQLLGRTADTLWGDHVEDAFGAGGLGLSGVGEGGGGSGSGIGLGSIGTVGRGGATAEAGSSLLAVGDLAKVAQAEGVESGSLFVYKMPGLVALRAHASALVPFLASEVSTESIAWFDSAGASARSALRFVNDTGQTLPAGTVSLFSHGGFSGESVIERMRGGERRFLTFGMDLDVEANATKVESKERTERLRFESDVLEEHFLRTTATEWELANRSSEPRSVYVKLSLGANATLDGTDAIDFDVEGGRPLAVFRVPPSTVLKRSTSSKEGLVRRVPLSDLSSKRLEELAETSSLPAPDRATSLEAAARWKAVERAGEQLKAAKEAASLLDKDLARHREDAKAIAQGDAARPIVLRIVALEEKINGARKAVEDAEREVKKTTEGARVVLAKLVR